MKKIVLAFLIVVGLLMTLSSCDDMLEALYPDITGENSMDGIKFVVTIGVRPDIMDSFEFQEGRPVIVQMVPFRKTTGTEDFVDHAFARKKELKRPDFSHNQGYHYPTAEVTFNIFDRSKYRVIAFFDGNDNGNFDPGERSTMAWTPDPNHHTDHFDPGMFDKDDYEWDLRDGWQDKWGDSEQQKIYVQAVLDWGTNIAQQDDWLMDKLMEGIVYPEPNRPPWANLWAPMERAEGVEVWFDGWGSGDEDGWIKEYNWDFGDGETMQTKHGGVSHIYTETGRYEVTLSVRDNRDGTDWNGSIQNGIDSMTVSIEIVEDTGAMPPTVIIDLPPHAIVGQEEWIEGWRSYDVDGHIDHMTVEWTLTPPSGPEITFDHTLGFPFNFDQEGTWNIALYMEDDEGLDTVRDMDLEVGMGGGGNAEPKADIEIEKDMVVVDEDFAIRPINEWDDGYIVSYKWDFGVDDTPDDEYVTTQPNTVWWWYDTAGTYIITLTVTDNEDATFEVTQEIVVHDALTELAEGEDYTLEINATGFDEFNGKKVAMSLEGYDADDYWVIKDDTPFDNTAQTITGGTFSITLENIDPYGYSRDPKDWLYLFIDDNDNEGSEFVDFDDVWTGSEIAFYTIDISGGTITLDITPDDIPRLRELWEPLDNKSLKKMVKPLRLR